MRAFSEERYAAYSGEAASLVSCSQDAIIAALIEAVTSPAPEGDQRARLKPRAG